METNAIADKRYSSKKKLNKNLWMCDHSRCCRHHISQPRASSTTTIIWCVQIMKDEIYLYLILTCIIINIRNNWLILFAFENKHCFANDFLWRANKILYSTIYNTIQTSIWRTASSRKTNDDGINVTFPTRPRSTIFWMDSCTRDASCFAPKNWILIPVLAVLQYFMCKKGKNKK